MVNAAVLPISSQPTLISAKINNVDCSFEIDSGSHMSFISNSDANRIRCNIVPSSHKVLGYSGSEIQILGEINVPFSSLWMKQVSVARR